MRNMESASGGVRGMSPSQGNGAWSSKSGDGVRAERSWCVTSAMTSFGSVEREPVDGDLMAVSEVWGPSSLCGDVVRCSS